MEQSKKPDTDTGSGSTPIPILAKENDHTADESKPSPTPTSIESGNTKPISIPEALSLLQTLCLDLRSMGSEVAILARKNRLYLIVSIAPDTGELAMSEKGHILLNNQPVSKIGD